MKVLVIEDNPDNAYLIRYLLEDDGHVVAEAGDALTGIAMAKSSSFDVILLDMQLPGMDGYEAAGQLKVLPSMAVVPVIAVTSFAMASDRDKALAAGCDAYMEKPINPDNFVAEVREIAGAKQRGASSDR
jgi:two-component system, cell cycle response regulator DivK